MRKQLYLLLGGMLMMFLLGGCGTSKGRKAIDFIVDVEKGREPVVLQLTDTQIIDSAQKRYPTRLSEIEDEFWATDKMNERCFDDIAETIEKTKPDLILMTGDLIYGEFDDAGTSFVKFVEFMDSFGIPWAPVFGNHDNESVKGVDWQCDQFENAKHCLFKQRELTGNGNYTVGIRQGRKITRVYFMLDSNGCDGASKESFMCGHMMTGAGFGGDQIEWYQQTAEEIRGAYPDVKFTFAFHIQSKAFLDVYAKYASAQNGMTGPINIDELEDKAEGDFGYLAGVHGAWDLDYRVWNTIKELGVDSVLVGHEHCNSFSVVYEGIRLQFGQKTGTYDRLNYFKEDGTIYSAACVEDRPLSGGTVMKLAEDGSIVDSYIYLCE